MYICDIQIIQFCSPYIHELPSLDHQEIYIYTQKKILDHQDIITKIFVIFLYVFNFF